MSAGSEHSCSGWGRWCADEGLKTSARRQVSLPRTLGKQGGGLAGWAKRVSRKDQFWAVQKEFNIEPGHQPGMAEGPDTSQDGVCVTQQGGGEQACTGTSSYPLQHFSIEWQEVPNQQLPLKGGWTLCTCLLAVCFPGRRQMSLHVRQTGDGRKGCLAQV